MARLLILTKGSVYGEYENAHEAALVLRPPWDWRETENTLRDLKPGDEITIGDYQVICLNEKIFFRSG